MTFTRRIALAVVASTVAAGLGWAAAGSDRHPAIFPEQNVPLKFSHKAHLEAGAECETCHEPASKSVKALDRLLPAHPECEPCHDIEKASKGEKVDPPSACSSCHAGFDSTVSKEVPRANFPHANLVFNHQVHVAKKVDCVVCHNGPNGEMKDVGLATRDQLPKMAVCLTCHNGSAAPSKCTTCHLTDGLGRLKQVFSSGVLRPAAGDPLGLDHGPRYEFTHGMRAKLDRAICTECHTESSCNVCHDAISKPLAVHPNDFITLHPIQARMDSLACEGCHRFQSFCAACHERVGIGLDADPAFRARNLRVHPSYAEWVDSAGPQHHAIAASRDIKSCMSCHREESCLTCHASRALIPSSRGTQPHPEGFAAICAAVASRNDRACLKCHTQTQLKDRGCQ